MNLDPRLSRRIGWLSVPAASATIAMLVLAADERTRVLATNTLVFAGSTAVLSLAMGAPLAFLLTRTDVLARRAATVALLALLFAPLYLLAAAWQAGWGVQGWYTLASGSGAILRGWRGAIFIQALAAVPWAVFIVGVGLQLAEPELEEEALLDASPGQVFRRVTMRRAGAAMLTALLWIFVAAASEMTITDLFLIRTYAEEVYTQFALGDVTGSATWSMVPSAAAIACVIALGLFVVARLSPADRHATERAAAPFRLGKWRLPATLVSHAMVAALLLVPVASLAVQAGRVVVRSGNTLERGWSAAQCLSMTLASPWRLAPEFAWTAAIGALAALAAVVVALPLAWMARGGGWLAVPGGVVVAVCLAVPGPVLGLAIIAIFNAPRVPLLPWLYDHSIAPIWLAQTIRALPLPALILWYGLRTIPGEVLAAARLEGASSLARLVRVVLPQRWPVVAAAWLAGLAVATGELDASILVVPPGVTTLPICIFGLIHYGVDDQVAGAALFLLGGFCAYGALFLWVVRRASRDFAGEKPAE